MKTFKVSHNSWHYKLNIQMVRTNDRINYGNHEETYVMSKDNLCSYWSMTIWSMFKVLLVTTLVIGGIAAIGLLLYMYTYSWIFYTYVTAVNTALVVIVILAIVGLVAFGTWMDKRKREKLDKILYEGETETSLTKAKYLSWKSGICLPIEFDT